MAEQTSPRAATRPSPNSTKQSIKTFYSLARGFLTREKERLETLSSIYTERGWDRRISR